MEWTLSAAKASPDERRNACDTRRVLVLAEPKSELVRERWARVERLGVRRDSDAYPVGTSHVDLAERRERLEHVLRDERDLLEPLTADLARGSMVAIIADSEGVILSA